MLLERGKQTVNRLGPSSTSYSARWLEPGYVLILGLLALLLLTPHVKEWLNPPTGDEPFYLMTTISLIRYQTLDEFENYDRQLYQEFAPTCEEMAKPHWGDVGPKATNSVPGLFAPGLRKCSNTPAGFTELPPHFSKNVLPIGNYTKHGLGLSFLIAPAYAFGGRTLVICFLNLLTALLALNCWFLAREMTGRRAIAWAVWASMLFTSPILAFSFLIFPAIPAALITLYCYRRFRLVALSRLAARAKNSPVVAVNGPFRALLLGSCLGALPWLHSVYLSLSIPLFLYFLFGGRLRRWRQVPNGWNAVAVACLLVPIIILGGLFMYYYIWLYGSPLPNTQDHAGFAPYYLIWLGLLGFFFDQKYGLLIYGPAYLLALVGCVLLYFRTGNPVHTNLRRSDLLWLGICILPNFLVMSSYNQWWGEWGPPARYLVPLVPLLAGPLAIALNEGRNWFVRVFLALSLIWSGAISIAWMINPHLMFHWQDNNPAKLLTWLQDNLLGGVHLASWFPSYVTFLDINNGDPAILPGLVWAVVAILLAIFATVITLRQRYHVKLSDNE